MKWHDLMFPLYSFLLCLLIRVTYSIPENGMPYPQFFLQPVKQSVKREAMTTIDCGAYGGIGNLTYTFYKGSTPQYSMMTQLKEVPPDPESGISSYFIPKISSSDRGYYQCVVEDSAGVVIFSDVIYISVVDNYLSRVDAPTVSKLLLSTTKLHVLNCTMPDSSPPAQPRWFKDGTPISVDDSKMFVSYGIGTIEDIPINIGDLVMFGINYEHTGLYTCAAYNYLLDSTENQFDVAYYNITVATSGELGEFSSDEAIVSEVTVSLGEEAYLFCAGIGNPAPETEFLTITPFLDGVKKTKTRLVVVSGESTTDPDTYYSTCRVGDSYHIVKLVVVEPPINSVDSVEFTDTKVDPLVYYIESDSPPRSISCDTSADLAKQWFKNGEVWDKGLYHETDLLSGFDLIANDIRPQDSGVYQCKAFSDQVSIYRTQILVVVSKLSIETSSPTLREYEGRNKKLACTVTGSPAPTITWTNNNRELSNTDNVRITHDTLNYPYVTTLEIVAVTLEDTGRYECGVYNYIPPYDGEPERIDSVSAAIDLKIVAPVSVTSPQETVISFAGKELLLTCVAYGEPKPSVPIWMHQDTILTNSPEFNITHISGDQGYTSILMIMNVNLANQGNYTCSSSNYVDIEEEASVRISVPVISPVKVEVPTLVEVERGVVEAITCNATGHPVAEEISWYHGNQLITEGMSTSLDGQTLTSVLSVTALSTLDGGEYRCNSSNGYNGRVYPDMGFVQAVFVSPVEIEADVKQITGVYGNSVNLVCRVRGDPLPDEIVWESRGFPVQDNKYMKIVSSFQDGFLVSELEIEEVRYSNERSYNCTASNYFKEDFHYSKDTIDVLVEYPVQVRSRSNYAYNTKGKPVDVVCEIEGKPLPDEVTWYFSGNPGQAISESEYYSSQMVSRDNVLNATLTINALTVALIGDYNCSASNVVDGVEYHSSQVINVEQVRRVIVTVLTGIKSVAKGDEANLTCFGEGVPPPQPSDIAWIFQGTALPSYSLKYLHQISEERIYKINSVLRISDSQLDDEGIYTCRFSNRDKTNSSFVDEKIIQLIVQVPVEVNFTDSEEVLQLYNGDTGQITCSVFGKPPPTKITWTQEKTGSIIETGSRFNISTTNSSNGEILTSILTIHSMTLDLEGTYGCTAENVLSGGRVVTTPAYKDILRIENVEVSAASLAVPGEVGLLARLTCTATGVPMPSYITWAYKGAKKNRPIGDSDHYLIANEKTYDWSRGIYTRVESTLTFKSVRWIDRGAYQCTSTNFNKGQDRSDYAISTLNVGQRVSINLDSAETLQTVIGNQVGLLTVPLYGYPAPTVTWLKDNVPVTSSADVLTSSSYIVVEEYSGVAQLTLNTVTTNSSGSYTVVASNTVHNTTYSAEFTFTVEVFYRPSISLSSTVQLLEMSVEKIPCQVSSMPHPSSITWFYNGTEVEQLSRPGVSFSVEEMVVDTRGDVPIATRNLVVKGARLSDGGVYTCKSSVFIVDQFYYAEKTINVKVVSSVVVTSQTESVDAEEGIEVNITCKATGYPLPEEILWFHNGSLIATSPNVQIQSTQVSFKQRSSSLHITSLERELFGEYECSSSNIVLGQLMTDSYLVSVFEETQAAVEKSITAKELMIIIILAVIILVVVFVVVVMLVCRRRRRKQRDRADFQKMEMDSAPRPNGAESTLRADQQKTGLIQIDPSSSDYRDVEYVELDPRVYKSDYSTRSFKPMPRKKRTAEYATIDTAAASSLQDDSESRLI